MTAKQPELFHDDRPRQLVVSGGDFAATVEGIKRDGGRVLAWETVPRHNCLWRLRIVWPSSEEPLPAPIIMPDAPARLVGARQRSMIFTGKRT